MARTPRYPVAPAAEPLIGSLLQTAPPSGGVEWLEGDGLFESFNSLTFGATDAAFCAPSSKDLGDSTDWINGFRMVAYGGVTCKAVGLDRDAQLRGVREAFDKGASVAVEAGVMRHRFQALAGSKGWAAPVDITPAGGAVKPIVGTAMLEAWMARRYVGRPTLHLPTVIASLLTATESIKIEGNRIYTKLGSSVVNGAGYDEPNTSPAGVAAPAGEKWLYVTGTPITRSADMQPRQAIDHTTNEVVVLAEQVNIVAFDGPSVAAVRVQVAG